MTPMTTISSGSPKHHLGNNVPDCAAGTIELSTQTRTQRLSLAAMRSIWHIRI